MSSYLWNLEEIEQQADRHPSVLEMHAEGGEGAMIGQCPSTSHAVQCTRVVLGMKLSAMLLSERVVTVFAYMQHLCNLFPRVLEHCTDILSDCPC